MEFSIDNDDEQNSEIFEYKDSDMNYCETEVAHDQIKTLKKEQRDNLIKLETIRNRINNLKKQDYETRKKILLMQEEEERENQIKLNKLIMKQRLMNLKQERERTLEIKKQKVRTERLINEQAMRNSLLNKQLKAKLINENTKNEKKEIEARIYDNKVLRTNENIVKKIKTKNQVMNKRT